MRSPFAFSPSTHLATFARTRLLSRQLPRPHRAYTRPRVLCTTANPPAPSSPTTPPAPVNPRRLRKGDTLDLEFEHLLPGGRSMARVPPLPFIASEDVGIPVYAPRGACPGDRIRCAITKVRRRPRANAQIPAADARVYAEAVFVELLASSPNAVESPCSHFGNFRLGGGGCGGCSSMHVPYALQLEMKQAQVESTFGKVCAMYGVDVQPIRACDRTLHYRNKMEFSFGRRWYEKAADADNGIRNGPGEYEYALGLHAPQRFDKVVQIQQCYIQHPTGNDILRFIRDRSPELLLEPYDTKMDTGYLRNIVLRTAKNASGEIEYMVNIVTSPCDVPDRLKVLAEELVHKFPSIICVMQNMCGVKGQHAVEHGRERFLSGSRDYLEQMLFGLKFRISANSFFQTNPEQTELLFEEVKSAANLTGRETVLDLFCGTGTIGLSLAEGASQVVGIDVVPSAIADARLNAAANGITNVSFQNGNLEKLKSFLEEADLPQPDVVVVDPPRAGLHPDLVQFLAKSSAKRIVYVSCNPVSQERDIMLLEGRAPGKFTTTRVQPVDMFPNTPHLECVCLLENTHVENSS